MSATFDRTRLDALNSADEVDIEISRSADSPVHRVTIWIVVDGDTPYIRSVRGPAGRWYRELSANPRGAIHVDGRRLAITAEPSADAETIRRVSEALTNKYAQRWPEPLASMLRDGVLSTTMRVEPA